MKTKMLVNLYKQILVLCFIFNTSFVWTQIEKINQFDSNGNRHGLWKGVYEKSNRIRYEGRFEHGKETGVFKYFDDTKKGDIIGTRDFSKGDGSCYVTFFLQNGNKVSEGTIDKNKQNQGQWTYYHKNSKQPMSVENYLNGKLNGKTIVFFPDGKVASETYYKNGVKEGVSKRYSKKGVVLEEIPYKNNTFDGWVTYRNPKGQLIAQGMYEKGLKKGIWKFYENGKLTKEVDTDKKDTKTK